MDAAAVSTSERCDQGDLDLKPFEVEVLPDGSLRSRVYARIGLLGNPSDGYGGAVLALSLANFYADVTLTPSPQLSFIPNREGDPNSFADLQTFKDHIDGHGFYGGIRILKATLRRFIMHCNQHNISIDHSKTFSLSYSTNIPRQRGLSGSSAIATAALNCFLHFFQVAHLVPLHHRPLLILSAENDLGITAGLQDRIIQVYGGVVLMDFSSTTKETSSSSQAGDDLAVVLPECRSLDPKLLPPLYFLYPIAPSGKDSGTVHSSFKERWQRATKRSAAEGGGRQQQAAEKQLEVEGENLQNLMNQVASLATTGAKVLENTQLDDRERLRQLSVLFKRNFELRRELFGDAVVGQESLMLVEVASSVGAAAKLTGSGGAVVVVCEEGEQQVERLKEACAERGLRCDTVRVEDAKHWASGG